MSKEIDLQRLQELATALKRTPDLSGSAADIRQRVAEWEEEALALTDDEDDEGGVNTGKLIAGAEEMTSTSGWRRVKARETLHIRARETDSDRAKELILAGEMARVPEDLLRPLIAAGLVDEY